MPIEEQKLILQKSSIEEFDISSQVRSGSSKYLFKTDGVASDLYCTPDSKPAKKNEVSKKVFKD